MEHLGYAHLRSLENDDLVSRLEPYGRSLGGVFARTTAEERQRFRQFQGSDGQITGTRTCQEALQRDFPSYSPPQLSEWIQARKANCNDEGRKLIDHIETALQKHVLTLLKSEHDSDPEAWWWGGIPKAVRKKVDERMNESDGKNGSREQNFDLLHYRDIITGNWDLFRNVFGHTSTGSAGREKQTAWIQEVGEMRNIVMHPSRQQFLSPDKLATLQGYWEWLQSRVACLASGIEPDETAKETDIEDS